MKIKELKPGVIEEVSGEISEKEDAREVLNRFGKRMKVCNLKLKDDTGEVRMTLWEDDIDKVKEGDKITIKNGWASVFRDEIQVSLGRKGELTKN